MAEYEWTIVVRRWNTYGDKIEGVTPAVIIAPDREQVTVKVRAAFNAKYDDFRKFWSHDWALKEVREVRDGAQV